MFRCPKSWDSLRPTPRPGVRHCETCDQSVYLSLSPEQAADHARQGRCVALLAAPAAPASGASSAGALRVLDPEVLGLVTQELALRYLLFPLARTDTTLIVAVAGPLSLHAQDDLRFLTDLNPEPVLAREEDIREAIERHYEAPAQTMELGVVELEWEPAREVLPDEDPAIVKLVNLILHHACKRGATRVIFERDAHQFTVSFEEGGALNHQMSPPLKLRGPIAERLPRLASDEGGRPGVLGLALSRGRHETFLLLPGPWDTRISLERIRKEE